MLRDEMVKYEKLTGENASHVPIIKIGAYLDGYDKGIEILDKIRAEIKALTDGAEPELIRNVDVLAIIDKYKAESELKEE